WTNDTFDSNSESALGKGSSGWYEWDTIATDYNYLRALNVNLDSSNGIGQVYADYDNAYPSGTVHAFLRGAPWGGGAYAGVFALALLDGPSASLPSIGFRCAYTP